MRKEGAAFPPALWPESPDDHTGRRRSSASRGNPQFVSCVYPTDTKREYGQNGNRHGSSVPMTGSDVTALPPDGGSFSSCRGSVTRAQPGPGADVPGPVQVGVVQVAMIGQQLDRAALLGPRRVGAELVGSSHLNWVRVVGVGSRPRRLPPRGGPLARRSYGSVTTFSGQARRGVGARPHLQPEGWSTHRAALMVGQHASEAGDVTATSETAGSGTFTGLQVGIVVLALAMAAGCAWGLSRRLAEYR
jgi:hypothetical protein